MSHAYAIIVGMMLPDDCMMLPSITEIEIALEDLNKSLQKKIEQNLDTPEDHEWVRLMTIELNKEIDRLKK